MRKADGGRSKSGSGGDLGRALVTPAITGKAREVVLWRSATPLGECLMFEATGKAEDVKGVWRGMDVCRQHSMHSVHAVIFWSPTTSGL